MEISLGIFIGMSIVSFLICLFDKEIKKQYDMITKIIASMILGAMTGMLSALVELIIWIVNM